MHSIADSSFVNLLSHELRTPLTSLLGYIELLESENNLSRSQIEFINQAGKSAENLNQVIDSMLELLCLDNGCLENHPRYLSIQKEIQPLIDPYIRLASEKNLYLHMHWYGSDHIALDRMMLRSIVRILVDNAIKFTDVGGVTLKFNVTNSTLSLTVSDTGIGISEESIPFILKRYWQESHGDGRKFGGLGIGLHILKRYVDAMNGQIYITTRKNEGTMILVNIPTT
jgi:signal transduction histidine kinase